MGALQPLDLARIILIHQLRWSPFSYLGEGLTKGAKDLRVGAFFGLDFGKGKYLIKRTSNARPYGMIQFCILHSAFYILHLYSASSVSTALSS